MRPLLRGVVEEFYPSRKSESPTVRIKLGERHGLLNEIVVLASDVRPLTLIEKIGEIPMEGKNWNVYDSTDPVSVCERVAPKWGPFTEDEATKFIMQHPHGEKLYMAQWPLNADGYAIEGGSPLYSPKTGQVVQRLNENTLPAGVLKLMDDVLSRPEED